MTTESPGVKLIVLIKRSPGMSIDEFRALRTRSDSDLCLGMAGLRRHVRSDTLDGAYRSFEPLYDAMDELWCYDSDAARAAAAGLRQSVQARVEVDRSRTHLLVSDERWITRRRVGAAAVKNVEFVTRRAGLADELFHTYWHQRHGPLAALIPPLRGYVQNHVMASPHPSEPPRWDGLAITWFDDVAAMRASAVTPEYQRTRADESNFLEVPLPFLLMREFECPPEGTHSPPR